MFPQIFAKISLLSLLKKAFFTLLSQKKLFKKAFSFSTQTYIGLTYIYFCFQDFLGDFDIVVVIPVSYHFLSPLGQVQIHIGKILHYSSPAYPHVTAVPVEEFSRFLFPGSRQGFCALVSGIPVVLHGPLDWLDKVLSSRLLQAQMVEIFSVLRKAFRGLLYQLLFKKDAEDGRVYSAIWKEKLLVIALKKPRLIALLFEQSQVLVPFLNVVQDVQHDRNCSVSIVHERRLVDLLTQILHNSKQVLALSWALNVQRLEVGLFRNLFNQLKEPELVNADFLLF